MEIWISRWPRAKIQARGDGGWSFICHLACSDKFIDQPNGYYMYNSCMCRKILFYYTINPDITYLKLCQDRNLVRFGPRQFRYMCNIPSGRMSFGYVRGFHGVLQIEALRRGVCDRPARTRVTLSVQVPKGGGWRRLIMRRRATALISRLTRT